MSPLLLVALAIAWPAMAGVTGRLILRFMDWHITHDPYEDVEFYGGFHFCKNSTKEEHKRVRANIDVAAWKSIDKKCKGCKQRPWFHAASWLWPITLNGLAVYVIITRPVIATWKAGLWLYRKAGPPALKSGDTP